MATLSDVHLALIPDGADHHIAKVRFTVHFSPEEVTLRTRFQALVPLFGEDPLVDEHLQSELSAGFSAEEGGAAREKEVSFRVANSVLDEDIFGDDEIYAAVELYAHLATGMELVDRKKSPVVVGNF